MKSSIALSICLLIFAGHSVSSSEYDDTYYDQKTKVARQQSLGTNSLGTSSLISFEGGNCQCANLGCSCCTGVRVKKLKFDREACVSVNYLQKDIGVGASVTLNNKQIYSTSVSLRNPPALCMKVPDVPTVSFCLRFHDLYVVNNGLHACLDLETHVKGLPVLKLQFQCMQM